MPAFTTLKLSLSNTLSSFIYLPISHLVKQCTSFLVACLLSTLRFKAVCFLSCLLLYSQCWEPCPVYSRPSVNIYGIDGRTWWHCGLEIKQITETILGLIMEGSLFQLQLLPSKSLNFCIYARRVVNTQTSQKSCQDCREAAGESVTKLQYTCNICGTWFLWPAFSVLVASLFLL